MKNSLILLASCLISFTALAQLQNNCTTTNFLTKRDANGNLVCSRFFDDGTTIKIGEEQINPNGQKIMIGNFSNVTFTNGAFSAVNISALRVFKSLSTYGNQYLFSKTNDAIDKFIWLINENKTIYNNVWKIGNTSSGGGYGCSNGFSIINGYDALATDTKFFIDDITGNIGIGTTTIPASYKLAVNGKIIAEELRVQLPSAWPDYVFGRDYKLPTLQEVEKQIKDKGHLANIPSAQDVAKEGIAVGEMNKLLLEKVEELTLYAIAQNKISEKQSKEIAELKAIVKTLAAKNK
jgi:hypothetical protein